MCKDAQMNGKVIDGRVDRFGWIHETMDGRTQGQMDGLTGGKMNR